MRKLGLMVGLALVGLACASGCEMAPATKASKQPSVTPESVLDWCIELGAAEYGGRTVYGAEGAAIFKRADRIKNECSARWRAGECATALECEVFTKGGGEFVKTYQP